MLETADSGAWTTMAPFDKYLQPYGDSPTPNSSDPTPPSTANAYGHSSYDDSHSRDAHGDGKPYGSSSAAGAVQFQMPPFMYGGPPTLAQGGGAEVLPAGLFASTGGLSSSWLTNAGLSVSSFSQPSSSFPPENPFSASIQEYLPAQPSSSSLTNAQQSASGAYTTPSVPWATSPTSPMSPSFAQSLSIQHPMAAPSALGLPVYSASGFDVLNILGRVANRSAPKIQLGPVDFTCSFLVTDVRRYDNPVVYASPTFCQLTGYEEHEVLGRNCRFLQSPDGRVQKGEERRYTNPEAVGILRKSLAADKEVQTSLVNYKKGGQAFINLVTVIPITGGVSNGPHEQDEVVYQVGFQVDLTQQPNAILQRLKDGSYIVNYSASSPLSPSVGRRTTHPTSSTSPMSTDLRTLLSSQAFVRSLPLSTRTNAVLASDKAESYDDQQLLDMMLLEALPDFVHVLSLKGVFLYVAPNVRRILGYAPEELVGKSVADLCHPADLVPLMRELKESSAAPAPTSTDMHGAVMTGVQSVQAALTPGGAGPPKTVDLLFRARAKDGRYVWLDCRGRLHVEPGKGRKAIIMSGRQRALPSLPWGTVARAGGLADARETTAGAGADTSEPSAPAVGEECEFWAEVARSGTVLFVGAGVRDVLGWGVGEVIGRTMLDWIEGTDDRRNLERLLAAPPAPGVDTNRVECELRRKDGRRVGVQVLLYRTDAPAPDAGPSSLASAPRAPAPLVAQVKLLGPLSVSAAAAAPVAHDSRANVFVELEMARETSWQYELQQLKYANRRLAEEVDALEVGASRPAPTSEVDGMDEKGKEANPSTEWRRGSLSVGKRTWEEMAANDGGPS